MQAKGDIHICEHWFQFPYLSISMYTYMERYLYLVYFILYTRAENKNIPTETAQQNGLKQLT